MDFDNVLTAGLLLIAAYTFLWPRGTQRRLVPAQRRAQRLQPEPRTAQRMMRTSVRPLTSYGALAYVVTAYCAVVVMIVRDVAQSCAGAWRDVLRPAQMPNKPVAQLAPPVAQPLSPTAQRKPAEQKPTPVDDDDFAETRAKVAKWDYVAPPPMPVQKQPSSDPELPSEPPELMGTGELAGTEAPETVGGKRKAAILAALDKGLTASQIADIMPIQRQRALKMVALVQEERTLAELPVKAA